MSGEVETSLTSSMAECLEIHRWRTEWQERCVCRAPRIAL